MQMNKGVLNQMIFRQVTKAPKEEKVKQIVHQIWKWALRNRWEKGQ